jgi:phosphatidylserine/phosphatidylglycerophosphate/cardiolipin synthase-like enzyme
MSMLGVSPDFVAQRVFVGYMAEPDGPFLTPYGPINGGRHIQVNSNIVLQDGHTLLRSSSNMTDRSLSALPCNTELGILIRSNHIANFQQKLWRRYFMIPDNNTEIVFTPEDAMANMVNEQGVVRRVVTAYNNKSTTIDKVSDVAMSLLHQLPVYGNKRKIHWTLTHL